IFIPEEKNEEQQMIYQLGLNFIQHEVMPVADQIEHQEEGLNVKLLGKAAELGILGASLPEEYGGFGKDYVRITFLSESYGSGGSIAVSISAHTGIGTLPILYFGTEEQKKKYLPRLASGELKAAYCLTEPGSGSDALSAKTTAILDPSGKNYIL